MKQAINGVICYFNMEILFLINILFVITEERKEFAKLCVPIYQKYYPEILEEIKGIPDG